MRPTVSFFFVFGRTIHLFVLPFIPVFNTFCTFACHYVPCVVILLPFSSFDILYPCCAAINSQHPMRKLSKGSKFSPLSFALSFCHPFTYIHWHLSFPTNYETAAAHSHNLAYIDIFSFLLRFNFRCSACPLSRTRNIQFHLWDTLYVHQN